MMDKRLPPGQFETEKWPILHQGDVPEFNETTWNFRLFGEVKEEKFLSYKEIMELPKTISMVTCDLCYHLVVNLIQLLKELHLESY